jgi:hypothetical protein
MRHAFRLAAILSILLGTSLTQEINLPDAPMPREAKVEFAVFAAEVVADGVSTRILYQRGFGENNPIAKPFVRAGIGGQVAASLLSVAAVGGAWAIFHRTHHDRMAKWMLRTLVIGEGINDIRQFRVMTQRH